jgi:glycosidase
MFVGAILIVVMSPKCAAKKDKHWFENTVVYQVYTPTFRDSDKDGVGDFNGIKEKLNDLRRAGVSAVWPTPLMSTNKNDFKLSEVIDPNVVDARFGTEAELKALIKRTHDLSKS